MCMRPGLIPFVCVYGKRFNNMCMEQGLIACRTYGLHSDPRVPCAVWRGEASRSAGRGRPRRRIDVWRWVQGPGLMFVFMSRGARGNRPHRDAPPLSAVPPLRGGLSKISCGPRGLFHLPSTFASFLMNL